MSSIGPGFRSQVKVYHPDEYRALRFSIAQRHWNTFRAAEEEGIVGKWLYCAHAHRILGRYSATSRSTCWDIVRRENLCRFKDAIARRFAEILGLRRDPRRGVAYVSGCARTTDARALFLEISMGLGASGGTIEQYPVPGFGPRWATVATDDWSTFYTSISGWREGRARTGKHYGYSVVVYPDNFDGDELTSEEAEAKIFRGELPIEKHPRSNFSGRFMGRGLSLGSDADELRAYYDRALRTDLSFQKQENNW